MRKQNMDPTAQALACLAQNYDAMFNVDFETNQCENYVLKEDFLDFLMVYDAQAENREYAERMGVLASISTDPNSIKSFLEHTSSGYVLNKLKKSDSHIVNFSMTDGKTNKKYQIKYVRNAFKGRQNVIVGIRDVTGEIGEDFDGAGSEDRRSRRRVGVKVEKGMAISRVDGERRRTGDVLERTKFDTLSQTWDAFVYSISHSVRNPLNAILAYADMVDRYADNPQVIRDFANKIKVSGRGMLNLLNDVIDLHSLEEGSVSLNEAPTDIAEVLFHVGNIVSAEARYKNIHFVQNGIDLSDRRICCDRQRLEQIMVNILDNAVKYTNPGGRVEFIAEELKSEEEGFASFKFTISDTGVGMTEEIRKHLFNSFEYEKSDKLNVVQGTGIGMTITKRLIDLLGGKLEVESQLGVGTCVTCFFKFRIGDELTGGMKKLADNVLVGKKVLLVEDNAMNREVARLILESEHLVVDEADDGAAAVDKVYNSEPGTYDYILMDLMMPYMSGFEAAKEIRKLEDRRLASIPIVALSANAYDDDRKRAQEVGMNEYITKPVNINELIQVLKKIESAK